MWQNRNVLDKNVNVKFSLAFVFQPCLVFRRELHSCRARFDFSAILKHTIHWSTYESSTQTNPDLPILPVQLQLHQIHLPFIISCSCFVFLPKCCQSSKISGFLYIFPPPMLSPCHSLCTLYHFLWSTQLLRYKYRAHTHTHTKTCF